MILLRDTSQIRMSFTTGCLIENSCLQFCNKIFASLLPDYYKEMLNKTADSRHTINDPNKRINILPTFIKELTEYKKYAFEGMMKR